MINIQVSDQQKEQEKKFVLQIPMMLELMDKEKPIRFYENILGFQTPNYTHKEFVQYSNELK